jgi:hypothetical protein
VKSLPRQLTIVNFACDNGVRQGENLFLFLFSLFLNDLETFLEAKNVTGLESISGDLENQLNIYLKLFIINSIKGLHKINECAVHFFLFTF